MKLFTLKAITVASLGALLAVGVPATANAKEAPTFGNPILSSGTVKQNLGSKTPVKLNLTVNGPAGAGDFYALANYKAGASSGTGASLNSPSECNAASDPAKKGKCKGTTLAGEVFMGTVQVRLLSNMTGLNLCLYRM